MAPLEFSRDNSHNYELYTMNYELCTMNHAL
jgi:hypothetical protein